MHLDLSPYVVAPVGSPLVYWLAAVVVHLGDATGGHYITYRHTRAGLWLAVSDDSVTRVSATTVLSAEAYMLLYEQHDETTSKPPSLSRL